MTSLYWFGRYGPREQVGNRPDEIGFFVEVVHESLGFNYSMKNRADSVSAPILLPMLDAWQMPDGYMRVAKMGGRFYLRF